MRVTMIGTGYVGLVTGACFADFGHEVICVDKDATKIEQLNSGGIPIYEPGLETLVEHNMREGRLSFTTEYHDAVAAAGTVFIAVGTPEDQSNGFANLKYVYAAAEEVAVAINGYTVIVNKSTVPVGTGGEVEKIIREIRPDGEFAVVSNPEFLREGVAIEDFKQPDRVVIGTDDRKARKIMQELYSPFLDDHKPIVFTSRRTSELIKYSANAFLAMKITFINELADLCEAVDADVQELAHGMGLDNRISSKYLNAGPGYGGSCFPKDTLALTNTAKKANSPLKLIETVIDINSARKRSMADKIIKACGGDVTGKTLAVLGLAFKPNTDDMREAPSLEIIPALQRAGATIRAFDPAVTGDKAPQLSQVEFCEGAYQCAEGADALIIITEWNEFRALDLSRLKSLLRQPVIVDLRNIYSRQQVKAAGIDYTSIGRSTVYAGTLG